MVTDATVFIHLLLLIAVRTCSNWGLKSAFRETPAGREGGGIGTIFLRRDFARPIQNDKGLTFLFGGRALRGKGGSNSSGPGQGITLARSQPITGMLLIHT
jgi:hypothetical protein